MSKPAYERYFKSREVIERVVVVGPMSEADAVMLAMHKDGWRTTFSGPYSTKKMFPKLDMTRFKCGMERVLEQR